MDIMFINKVAFLVTTSQGLRFGTVENLHNRQVPTVAKALVQVCQKYGRRGFQVNVVNADPEFVALQGRPKLGNIEINPSAQNKHVGTVECYICTIKDRVQSAYNSVCFSRIPRVMLI